MEGKGYKTFKGGIHPSYFKELSSGKPITTAPVPEEVFIPLSQHVGSPNEPIVSVGDRVNVGQKIGETGAFISAPVHSSVNGVVKAIEEIVTFNGGKSLAVIIKADAEQPPFSPAVSRSSQEVTSDDIRNIAREAGLVGMGGAAFPTHVKLSPPKDKPVDTVIINACECEPFLTCDHRLMLERSEELVEGLALLMKAVGAKNGIIGIEANKMDAVEKIEALVRNSPDLSVEVLEVKYPEGAEKQLIFAVTGRKVPPGKLPSEVGCLVQNVGTAIALYEAVTTGKPLYERVVTVTGDGIREPGNFLVRVGTPISVLIEAARGILPGTRKLIMGGPMTGWAQSGTQVPVVKGTSGIVAMTERIVDMRDEHECVRCSKCVDVCPMSLMPNFIVDVVKREDWAKAEMWGALDCFECGCCSYTCPAYIPHVEYVRKAKAEIAALKK